MRFLMYELILKDKKDLLEQILTEAKPPVSEDVVYVYAVVEGWAGSMLKREEFYRAYHPVVIHGRKWRAISWTTAASVAAVVELVASGKLQQKGFVKQEQILLDDFNQTQWGSLYSIEQNSIQSI
jgi:saccharopine dehydrogenase-like NADP-dependent oxidoreductase